ncbi:TRAP transporter solute receptor, TAXI family [Pseudonocardia thermophila]|uniref:TRAP transporter solute receptor, TAXI family n=1 Tax=Pseudonocardia thermophila TaxID=1848 RepID=A0A1M6XNL8_PSETH|nr:TAXI family TRAP transporter solute-binding subunit [Pseudonocardia thermophila]SHL07395.1 TRAP transporter solute receptor, TAXI family [Pseudonocardia thermophila]
MKLPARLIAALLTALVVAVTTACGGPDQSSDQCRAPGTVKIGSGATGGLYFALAGRLTELLHDACISATTITGSAAGFFRDGADVVITQTDQAYAAVSGTGGQGFQPGERFDYATLAVGWDNAGMIVTRQNTPIGKVGDLTPEDVIGVSTQAAADAGAEIFRMHGVNPRMTVIEDYEQTITALRQGQITAILRPVAHPLADFVRTHRDTPLRAVAFDADVLRAELAQAFPDYSLTTVRAGTYEFLTTDYPTWSRKTVVVARKDLNPDVAAEIVRTLYERAGELAAAVPYAKDFTLDTVEAALPSVRVPFHAGAVRYFAEHGVDVPAA